MFEVLRERGAKLLGADSNLMDHPFPSYLHVEVKGKSKRHEPVAAETAKQLCSLKYERFLSSQITFILTTKT
ncbi:hypothetical protein M0802_012144 [Mischocyttarus mexicanus]|nr:hypothetical protein M0802_012144 [Mischocyttarus mexicanus]